MEKKRAQSVDTEEQNTEKEIETSKEQGVHVESAVSETSLKPNISIPKKEPEIESESVSLEKKVFIGIGVAMLVILFMVLVSEYGSSNKKGKVAQIAAVDSVALKKEQARKDSIAKVLKIEQARKDSIAKAERIKLLKNSIRIKSAYLSSPNSAGGVDANFYYVNKSSKTIKYLVWHGYPKNAVGDMVFCDIRDRAHFNGKDTGPIKPGRSGGGCWDCAWYNWTAKKLVLTGIDIEFMDGSSLTINQNELQYVR